MTREEVRHIVEASTRFDVRGALVWVREVRWQRAVTAQRAEDVAGLGSQAAPGDAADAVGRRSSPCACAQAERQAARDG